MEHFTGVTIESAVLGICLLKNLSLHLPYDCLLLICSYYGL